MNSRFASVQKPILILAVLLAAGVVFWTSRWNHLQLRGDGDQSRSEAVSQPSSEDFFRYTPPAKIERLANEWEPQQALVISLSLPEAMGNFDIAKYQIKLLEVAHQYLDIYVFCEHRHSKAFAYFLSLIKRHPKADAILAKTKFVDSRPLMRWTRDFGPVFGMSRKGQLVAIDFVYRNLLKELEGGSPNEVESFRNLLSLHGDAMPADVVAALQGDYDIPIQIVRPPISMDGGDFVSDGKGNVFVSRQTLTRNGGDREELQHLFQRYYGAKKLHIMEALPGTTVRHLDMILKFVDFETVVLPDYQESPESQMNPYRAELSRKVQSILQKNERYIRKHFPKHRILKIPMPPILLSNRSAIIIQAKQEFIKVVALEWKLRSKAELESLTSAELVELEKEVITMIRKDVPTADFRSEVGFDAILRSYGQMPLETFIELHAEPVTSYRSYINSVFLNSEKKGRAFLVPRFTSKDPAENRRLEEWEAVVENVYRDAWPDAKVHWINCDSMVSDMGFLHCSTITVPSLPFKNASREDS